MFKKLVFVLAAITIFAVAPTFAAPTGCNRIKFQGTYTSAAVDQDVFGDGLVRHSYVFQLEIRGDGTASLSGSIYYDLIVNTGANTPAIGSWTCRADGKLVVSVLAGLLGPIPPGTHPDLPSADISLDSHVRTTYLFSVDDVNTLTRIQQRGRYYGAQEDPTNPTGGELRPLNTSTRVYTRFTAADADLLLP